VDYSKATERGFALLQSPFPGDKRFQNVSCHDERFDMPENINLEILQKHRNTKNAPSIGTYATRKLHWPEYSDLPDQNYYSSLDRPKIQNPTEKALDVGALEF
jgi:hypothetical protein